MQSPQPNCTGTDGTLTFTADNVVQFTVDDTTFTTADNLNFSLAGTSSMTIASLTENDVVIVGASGLLEDSAGNLTFSGSELAVTGSLKSSLLTDNDVLIAGTAGIVEDSGGNLTFNGTTFAVTGAATVSTDLTVGESVYVTEQASAGADNGGDGQIWVRADAPNTLMFTDDVGNDFTANNVLEIAYEYDSVVTTSDPGAGKLNFNSVTIGSITTLYINDADNTARDNSFLLANLAIGDVLTFRSATDPADYIVASISSVTDSTGFWTIGLTLIHNGTIFTDIDEVRISVEWQSKGVGAVPTLITVADSSDSTSFPAFFEDATGDLGPKTDSQLIYNATSGQLGATSFISTALTENDVLIAGTSGLIEDSGGALTWVGSTLLVTGDLDVDNININLNTISQTSTDTDLVIQGNGTGSINFLNGSGEEILELNDTVDAINGLAITPGATGVPALISAGTGSTANIDIGFIGSGTGVLTVSGTTNYEVQVTADDDIPNKKYVDDLVAATGGSGTLDSVTGIVNIATVGAQNIGPAAGIPINAHIISVIMEVTDVSDTTSTVTVGDATNGADSYMTIAENDPEVLGTYVADTFVDNTGGAVQATATVANDSTASASATIIITFRHA